MNTASLSGILTHVGALTDADVRELEKLADSFPYCQTAHVLLAKALHDRGSVLAGQKLRRAATAAADRRVLRRLLLTPPPVAVEPEPETATTLAVNATGELVTAPEPVLPAVSTDTLEASEAPEVTAVTEATAAPEAFSPTADSISEPEATIEQPDEQPAEQTAESQPTAAIEQIAEPEIVAEAEPEAQPETAPEPEPTPEITPQAEVIVAHIEAPLPTPVAASLEPETEESDPATAPAPAIADFDLVPDTSPAAVDLLLFAADELSLIPVGTSPAALALFPEAVADAAAPTAVTPTIPALAPDHLVWYAMANSRMGIELTAADFAPFAPTEAETEPKTEADTESEPTTETPVTAPRSTEFPNPAPELLAEWLPTAPPDARWAEHEAAHRPPPPPRRPFDYQFALIDRFLREKPRLRTVDPTRPLPEKLPDLAQRAARPDSEVVSESMARILARQGKTTRAISMYEQLQARLPEKAAIFAAQITALRGAAE